MATKTDTPIMQTPFSINLVPNQVIADQQGLRLSDVTKNVSGVQNNWGYGQIYEGFAIRGFETNTTLRDGLRAGGEANGRTSVDMANVEDGSAQRPGGDALRASGTGWAHQRGDQTAATSTAVLGSTAARLVYSRADNSRCDGAADVRRHIALSRGGRIFPVGLVFHACACWRAQLVAPSLLWKPNAKLQASLNVEYRRTTIR